MNFSILFLIISIVFISLLLIFLLSKKPRTKLSILFSLKLVCVDIWLIGTLLMFANAENSELVLFFDRFVYIGAVAFPPLLLHFTVQFIDKINKYRLLVLGTYIISFFFLITSRFSIFVDGIFIYNWGVHSQAHIAHHFFLAYFILIVLASLALLYTHLRKQDDVVEIERTKYMLFAFTCLYAVSFFAFLPAYNVPIYPIPFVTGVFFTFFIVYAITRYRLMSLQVILRRSAVYLFVFLLCAVAVLVLGHWLLQYDQYHEQIIYGASIIIIFLLMQPLYVVIKRLLWRPQYDFTIDMDKTSELDVYLNEYFLPLYENFKQEFKCNDFVLYTIQPEQEDNVYALEFPRVNYNDCFVLQPNDEHHLQKTTYILNNAEIKKMGEINKVFRGKKSDYIIPLSKNDVLLAFIFIKMDHRIFSDEQITVIKRYQQNFSSILHMALNLKYLQRSQ